MKFPIAICDVDECNGCTLDNCWFDDGWCGNGGGVGDESTDPGSL